MKLSAGPAAFLAFTAVVLPLVVADSPNLRTFSRAAINKGGSCNSATDRCADGLICAGPDGKKRCVKPRQAPQDCGFTPYQVCDVGLICAARRCRPVPVGKGSTCNSSIKCPRPYSCVGEKGKKRCFKKRGPGAKCGFSPFQVCKKGLICAARICRPVPIGKGSSCNRNVRCPKPLRCVGPKGNRRCFKKRDVGDSCGATPFKVCKRGLICAARRCRPVPMRG